MASTDARPIPRKNAAWRVTFPIFDADGDLVTGAASLDSEVSKDGGTFTDCTNEATEIATSSGVYYLELTADEMNADTVAIIVKTGTAGAKTTPIIVYPEEAGDVRVDAVQISGDSTAADNLEAFMDGTGYAGGTIKLGVDAVAISGDTTAADNFETMLDGTGGKVLSLGGLDIDATGAGVDGTGTAVKVQGDIGTTAFALTIGGHEGVYVDAAGRGVYMLTSGKGVEIDASDIGVLVTTSLEGVKIDSGGYSLALYTAETGSPIYVSPPGDDFTDYLVASVADAVWDEALANRAVDTASTGGALNYIKGRVANLSPGSIAVQSPVLSSDSFEMIRGDSYNTTTDYDRSITFSVTTPLSIMTTAAEVYGYFVYGTNMIVQQPTVTTTDTNVYDIKFEFTNEQTVLMTSGTWDIKVWWNTVTTEGDVTTLVSGTFTIVEPVYDGGDGADGLPAP